MAGTVRVVSCLDNGGVSFLVRLWTIRRVAELCDGHGEPLRRWHYRRAWIGSDPDEGPDDPAVLGRPWWHGGNRVLLQLDARTYVFVGMRVLQFRFPRAAERIRELVSPVPHPVNLVPMPFAVGRHGVYLFEAADTPRWAPHRRLRPYVDPSTQFFDNPSRFRTLRGVVVLFDRP